MKTKIVSVTGCSLEYMGKEPSRGICGSRGVSRHRPEARG